MGMVLIVIAVVGGLFVALVALLVFLGLVMVTGFAILRRLGLNF